MATQKRDVQAIQLREALTPDGCPICALALRSVHRYLDHFLYESVNDPWVRAELVESRGFCGVHAAQLLKFRDPVGVAIVYGHMLKEFREAFGEVQRRQPAGGRPRSPGWRCPRPRWPSSTPCWSRQRFFLGSVSDRVAHHAPCSVMIVKEPEL